MTTLFARARRRLGHVSCALIFLLCASPVFAQPAPLLTQGHPVDWWFAFKLNAHTAPDSANGNRPCPFGGTAQAYRAFSQEFAFASSDDHGLNAGNGLLGTGPGDPLGATFAEIYQGAFHFVVWNDQFYDDPVIAGCSKSCGGPWGHSKGILTWDDSGAGLVVQVTTPDWPGAGSAQHPRAHDGNTLGCVADNDVLVSQHFFALRLTREDMLKVLQALLNASVVTDPHNPQLVSSGGPAEIRQLAALLGQRSASQSVVTAKLSSGVTLISKPSALHVPPWQLVSASLGGVPLRTATWWTAPAIPSTTTATVIGCWSPALGAPGAVQIATTGTWEGKRIGLRGGAGADFNHAKIGVSTDPSRPYVIFGDMNQQGALATKCASSQNGRGGLFFVVEDSALAAGIGGLLAGADDGPQ